MGPPQPSFCGLGSRPGLRRRRPAGELPTQHRALHGEGRGRAGRGLGEDPHLTPPPLPRSTLSMITSHPPREAFLSHPPREVGLSHPPRRRAIRLGQ